MSTTEPPAHLVTQTEARAEAKAENESGEVPAGLAAVAGPWPPRAWGGHEQGWTVYWVTID